MVLNATEVTAVLDETPDITRMRSDTEAYSGWDEGRVFESDGDFADDDPEDSLEGDLEGSSDGDLADSSAGELEGSVEDDLEENREAEDRGASS